MPLASFHYAVPSLDELLRDVVGLVLAEEGLAAQPELPGGAHGIRDATRRALTAYLGFVKRDPGHERALFELTQYALCTPALHDLPVEQCASYHALAIELIDAVTAPFHPDWSVPAPDLARLVMGVLAWPARSRPRTPRAR